MSDDGVLAVCDVGHEFILKGFDPLELDEDVIMYIAWCPEMIAKPEVSGLILECGARVVWLRNPPLTSRPKERRLRSKQLDLFYDTPEEGLDKSNEKC